jgi:hypothetical protein
LALQTRKTRSIGCCLVLTVRLALQSSDRARSCLKDRWTTPDDRRWMTHAVADWHYRSQSRESPDFRFPRSPGYAGLFRLTKSVFVTRLPQRPAAQSLVSR